ncbi:colicin E5-related ribonuclease [Marinomonas sp. THO17]|uniref:colicin E5-related ribonuclease n=1 Tax=Marinomonas sp. THO17 TaxID=3149048 RepID=UPI00336C239E
MLTSLFKKPQTWSGLFGKSKVTKEVTTQFEKKIEKQMGKRDWDKDSVNSTIENPNKTVSTRDTRWNSDEPATAYIPEDGHYVVRNDNDGTIVQISNVNKADWKPPFE